MYIVVDRATSISGTTIGRLVASDIWSDTNARRHRFSLTAHSVEVGVDNNIRVKDFHSRNDRVG
jgi:hypothetical protein